MKQRFQYGNAIYEVGLKSGEDVVVSIEQDGEISAVNLDFHPSGGLCLADERLPIRISRQGLDVWVSIGAHTFKFSKARKGRSNQEVESSFAAPMPGKIVKLGVSEGEEVEAGTVLVVMEAMKMEHAMTAPNKGKVEKFHFTPGDLVPLGAQLLDFLES